VVALPSDSTDVSRELRGTIVKLLEDIDVDLSNLCTTVWTFFLSFVFSFFALVLTKNNTNKMIDVSSRRRRSRQIPPRPFEHASQR